jgi:hypothetical protein
MRGESGVEAVSPNAYSALYAGAFLTGSTPSRSPIPLERLRDLLQLGLPDL